MYNSIRNWFKEEVESKIGNWKQQRQCSIYNSRTQGATLIQSIHTHTHYWQHLRQIYWSDLGSSRFSQDRWYHCSHKSHPTHTSGLSVSSTYSMPQLPQKHWLISPSELGCWLCSSPEWDCCTCRFAFLVAAAFTAPRRRLSITVLRCCTQKSTSHGGSSTCLAADFRKSSVTGLPFSRLNRSLRRAEGGFVAKFPEPHSTLQMQLEQHNTKFLTQLSTWHYSMNHTTECRVHNHRWPHSTKFT